MKDNTLKWVLWTLIVLVAIIGWFGMFWTLSLTNITITHQIKMDTNTRDYLIEHDYCFQIQQPPFESNLSTNMFMGDCEYLDTSIFKLSQK